LFHRLLVVAIFIFLRNELAITVESWEREFGEKGSCEDDFGPRETTQVAHENSLARVSLAPSEWWITSTWIIRVVVVIL